MHFWWVVNSRCFQHEKCYVLTFNVVLLAIQKMYLSIRRACCYGDNCMSDLEEVGRELYGRKGECQLYQ